MAAKNYTPIDDLIRKTNGVSVSAPKEAEPFPRPLETTHLQEAVEHEPSAEVKPFVQPRQETIKLPPDLKSLGLEPASPSQFSTYQNVKLPISDEKIMQGLHSPINSSIRWLSELALYILKHAHLTLRVVGGKVVRVIKP